MNIYDTYLNKILFEIDILISENNWKLKNKHMRYKNRYSFITSDNYYRIDLTIVKSTKYNDKLNKYEMTELFKTSNILNQPEYYELEIEFIGNKQEYNTESINNIYQKGKLYISNRDLKTSF